MIQFPEQAFFAPFCAVLNSVRSMLRRFVTFASNASLFAEVKTLFRRVLIKVHLAFNYLPRIEFDQNQEVYLFELVRAEHLSLD